MLTTGTEITEGYNFLPIGRSAVAHSTSSGLWPDRRRWAKTKYPQKGKMDLPPAEGRTEVFVCCHLPANEKFEHLSVLYCLVNIFLQVI